MKLEIDANDLRALIERVIAETIARLDADRGKLDGRFGYSEPEAAALLGVQRHALRDARLRGEVQASRIGKRVIYSRAQLLTLLDHNQL